MNIEPYEVQAEETRAAIYRFGELHAVYDIVSDAYEDCARLNIDFKNKAEMLHKAFVAYNNAPHGWIWEARMDEAIYILEDFLVPYNRQHVKESS